MTQNLDRFKFRWFNLESKCMCDVISSMIEEDYIVIDYDNGVKLSDGVLMQCTGLKDKNGKLLYEGDIVKNYINYNKNERYEESKEEDINYIIYRYNRFEFGRVSKLFFKGDLNDFVEGGFRSKYNPHDWYYSIEIIGNIYENPELLNEKINN